jgi:8-oxo-dGTP diphosphatase
MLELVSGRLLLVVAGVIERDGKILVCQRRAGARHEFKWEFPGGKVEDGETPMEALARELDEELGIQAAIGAELVRYEFRYPKRPPMLLIFYRVTEFSGQPENRQFEEILWQRGDHLPHLDFLEGDVDFVRRLARGDFDPGRHLAGLR